MMFDRYEERASRPKGFVLEGGEAGWALQALTVARIVSYSIDCTSGVMVCSDSCTGILGVPPAGLAADWQGLVFAEDRARYQHARAALKPESPAFEVEYRVRNAVTGKPFRALDRGAAEFDAEGRVSGIRGAIIDVSARTVVPRDSFGAMADITERNNWEMRHAMLLRELSHRLRNTLAVLQSVARQTLRSSPSPRFLRSGLVCKLQFAR